MTGGYSFDSVCSTDAKLPLDADTRAFIVGYDSLVNAPAALAVIMMVQYTTVCAVCAVSVNTPDNKGTGMTVGNTTPAGTMFES